MADGTYNWDPMTPAQVREVLSGMACPWWISGGWAIDLFLGRQTRPHDDTDVLIRRDDQLLLQEFLSEWDLHKTQQPGLKPWPKGEFLTPGVNDVWCRRTPDSPWSFQIMLLDTRDDSWVFRRDPAITGPIAALGQVTASGIPYLSPEIQLLYKARSEPLDKDNADFRNCAPLLEPEKREWLLACLKQRLPNGHMWIALLEQLRG
jgi:hypothetical protein